MHFIQKVVGVTLIEIQSTKASYHEEGLQSFIVATSLTFLLTGTSPFFLQELLNLYQTLIFKMYLLMYAHRKTCSYMLVFYCIYTYLTFKDVPSTDQNFKFLVLRIPPPPGI